jgi:hypothetical protein
MSTRVHDFLVIFCMLGVPALATACGKSGLEREHAAKLIAASFTDAPEDRLAFSPGKQCAPLAAPFGPPATAYVSVQRMARGGFVQYRALQADDWKDTISYYGDQAKCPVGAGEWIEVTLTPKGQTAAKQWEQVFSTFIVPLANPAFIEVTGIVSEGETSARADYAWQWRTTEVGKDVGVDVSPQHATGIFTKYDDGWRLTNNGLTFGKK